MIPSPALYGDWKRWAEAVYRSTRVDKDKQYGAGDGLTIVNGELTVLGTPNRIVVTDAGVDIAANYIGQTSITTLGTVTTGTWQGTPVAITFGGTGATNAPDARINLGFLVETVTGEIVEAADLSPGAIGLNTADGRLYVRRGTRASVFEPTGLESDNSVRVRDLGSAAFISAEDLTGLFRETVNVNYQIVNQDARKLLVAESGTPTYTLPPINSVSDWWPGVYVKAQGTTLTVAGSGADLIDGAATLALADGDAVWMVRTATEWTALQFGGGGAAPPTYAGTFLLDDGSATADGVFMFDDGDA